jgi:hypothetical protein
MCEGRGGDVGCRLVGVLSDIKFDDACIIIVPGDGQCESAA